MMINIFLIGFEIDYNKKPIINNIAILVKPNLLNIIVNATCEPFTVIN